MTKNNNFDNYMTDISNNSEHPEICKSVGTLIHEHEADSDFTASKCNKLMKTKPYITSSEIAPHTTCSDL